MPSVKSAEEVLDQTFLEIRAKLLDLAASLDRIDRADSAEAVKNDPRVAGIRQSLQILHGTDSDRAQQIQMVFSDAYESGWNRS